LLNKQDCKHHCEERQKNERPQERADGAHHTLQHQPQFRDELQHSEEAENLHKFEDADNSKEASIDESSFCPDQCEHAINHT